MWASPKLLSVELCIKSVRNINCSKPNLIWSGVISLKRKLYDADFWCEKCMNLALSMQWNSRHYGVFSNYTICFEIKEWNGEWEEQEPKWEMWMKDGASGEQTKTDWLFSLINPMHTISSAQQLHSKIIPQKAPELNFYCLSFFQPVTILIVEFLICVVSYIIIPYYYSPQLNCILTCSWAKNGSDENASFNTWMDPHSPQRNPCDMIITNYFGKIGFAWGLFQLGKMVEK